MEKEMIKLLSDNLKSCQDDIAQAHKALDRLKIPTNGLDAKGKSGSGKRQTLSLEQRIGIIDHKKLLCDFFKFYQNNNYDTFRDNYKTFVDMFLNQLNKF